MTETSQDKRSPEARRKRINRLKKMILTTICLLILIPLLGDVVLGMYTHHLKKELRNVEKQYEWMEKLYLEEKDRTERLNALLDLEARHTETGSQDVLDTFSTVGDSESGVENRDTEDSIRRVYLTFDDGPSEQTEKILDILNDYQIKATFFTTGKPPEQYGDVYRRIVAEGHTLGMHSYSHNYSKIYASKEAFAEDLENLRNLLYQETGIQSTCYRFPGGSSNTVSKVEIEELIDYLNSQNIVYYDWNVSAADATSEYVSSERIANRVLSQVGAYKDVIVLMHDSSDKKSTVEALPMMIEGIQKMEDTVILPITDTTIPIQHIPAVTQ